jgi:uncharacterized membrane protein YhaH (DUF805 family)
MMDLKWFLFSFEGRVNRKPFWIFNIVVSIFGIILNLLFGIDIFLEHSDTKAIIFYLIFLWPGLAVQAKRWHDRNKSALWILIELVPIIGGIWALIEIGVKEGTKGANRFGNDPLGHEISDDNKLIVKPIDTAPISEGDIGKRLKEAVIVVLVTLSVIFLVVLGTWIYLSYIKR